jgi:putative type I restiction/modification specificity protein (fragment)
MRNTMKNNRTFLEKLLDGAEVKWMPLGDVADYEQPTKYLVNSTVYNDNYPTPVLTAGKTFILGYTNEDEGIYFASKSPVIIFDDFTTANKWVDFDFKAKSSAMKMITSKNEKLALLKYIYYWLNTLPNNQTDGDHKRQWISNYANKLIPIPPLSVQTEIVKTLDALTALTSELILRRKQYEYYREKLLSEEELGKVGFEWRTIDEVFHLKNGYTPSKSIKKYWENGTIPWFRMEDIRENGRILNTSLQKVSESAVKGGRLFPANSIIVATSATIGEHALITTPFLANQRFTVLSLKPEYIDKFNIYFLYYYCFIFDDWCLKNTTVSSFSSVDMNGFRKFRIPLIQLKEQQRIVSILDKFETLTNSITKGLPLAIEQSQKRYEYYRELLLNFE